MKVFTTQIKAIDPDDGELKVWKGPDVYAQTWQLAEQFCYENMGYCKVVGECQEETDSELN